MFLRVETDAAGAPKRYPRSAILDSALRTCGSMQHTVAYEPSEEEAARLDHGLFLINTDRLRTVELVRVNGTAHHYRVQSYFYFRQNASAWPVRS